MADRKTSDDKAVKAAEESKKSVDALFEQELKQGYRGVSPDPTPRENYTVKGVTSGKPTPETDADQARKVAEHQATVVEHLEGRKSDHR